MFPDREYASPRGSYGRPVPVPTSDPDASPTFTLSVNCAWLAYIRGALQQLLLQATWDTDDPATLLLAQQRAATLIAMFEECPGVPAPFACDYDLRTSDQGFVNYPRPSLSPAALGVYIGGSGWNATTSTEVAHPANFEQGVQIFLTLPYPVSCGIVSMNYDFFKGTFSTSGWDNSIQAYLGSTPVADNTISANADSDGYGKPLFVDCLGAMCDTFYIVLTCAAYSGIGTPGFAVATDFTINGTGLPPC